MDNHFNPVINQRLQVLAANRDWQGIVVYVQGLSNAQFRTAGYVLAERVLPTLADSDAWSLTSTLVAYHSKAFLVTMLKPLARRLAAGQMQLRTDGCRNFLRQLATNPIDRQKALLQLLPAVSKPLDIQWLFRKTGVEEGKDQVPYLLRIDTLPAAYGLFHTLRHVEHDRSLLVGVAYALMKRGDGLGFNLASLLQAYYGLDEVKGTFSLQLQPYQLARIENSYDAFLQIMKI